MGFINNKILKLKKYVKVAQYNLHSVNLSSGKNSFLDIKTLNLIYLKNFINRLPFVNL